MRKLLFLVLVLLATTSFAQTVMVPQSVKTTVSPVVVSAQVSVTNVATLIKGLNLNRNSIVIRNLGPTDMYIGNKNVTIANGLLVKANEVIVMDRNTAAIFGITGGAATTASYLEE